MRKAILIMVLILLLLPAAIYAGTTGKIMGKVTDAQSGKPVEFVNVMIGGTGLGALTEPDGSYIIINIPPGVYDVVCQGVGYANTKITGVKINVDETYKLNIQVARQGIALEGITVTAKQELVKRDQSGSQSSISSETIENMAIDGIEALVATKAGAVNTGDGLHIRGGRANEVAYTIDGMSVSDPVDGGAALSVDTDAIANMSVSTGAFTAEYGNAQSGIVNIVTRSGSKDFSGKLEYSTDQIDRAGGSNRDEVKLNLGGPVLFWGDDKLRERFTFFFNAAGLWSDGRWKDFYYSDANADLKYLTYNYEPYNPDNDPYRTNSVFGNWDGHDDLGLNIFGKSDGIEVPRRNINQVMSNFKTKFNFNVQQNVTFAYRSDNSVTYPYSHAWRYALRHYAETKTDMEQYVATYDHLITSKMNLKVKGSYYTKETFQKPKGINLSDFYGVDPGWDDSNDFSSIYDGINFLDADADGVPDWYFHDASDWVYSIQGQEETTAVTGFTAPNTMYGSFINDKTTVYSFRSDFEYQYNQVHGFKSGIEVIKNDIKKDRISNPQEIDGNRFTSYLNNNCEPIYYVFSEDGADSTAVYAVQDRYQAILAARGSTDGYHAEPWQGAFYVQDRIDWEDMLVNAGLRFDFWHLGNDYDIITPDYTGSYLDSIKPTDETDPDYDADMAMYKRLKDQFKKLQMSVSPRFGVSHPISETSVVHFAYNYQYQLPQMQYIYTTARPEDAILSSSGVVLGNPELDPQLTVTYEVGLQQQLSDFQVLDITAYFKNIYNYVSIKEIEDPDEPMITWYQYVSQDYGSARGVDINLERRLENFISGSMSYSLGWANGNNSSVSSDENLREFPLDWDVRHSFNLNLEYRVLEDEEAPLESVLDIAIFPLLFGTDYSLTDWIDSGIYIPFDNFAVNVLYGLASGIPYTPTTKNGSTLDINSERMDYTDNWDLSIVKNFSLENNMRFKVYAQIHNLFDTENINSVYSYTGNVWNDGWDNDGDYIFPEEGYVRDLYVQDPSRVGQGRTMELGVAFNF